MKVPDHLSEVMKKYKKYFDEIEKEFQRQNQYFLSLTEKDHNKIGEILKHHLIVEYYLTSYLISKSNDFDFSAARLSFSQKIALLSKSDIKAQFIKPGIIELNKIRNKFGHNLNAEVSLNELPNMLKVINISRPKEEYTDPIQVIRIFAAVASTMLIVSPEKTNLMWEEIFTALRNKPEETD